MRLPTYSGLAAQLENTFILGLEVEGLKVGALEQASLRRILLQRSSKNALSE